METLTFKDLILWFNENLTKGIYDFIDSWPFIISKNAIGKNIDEKFVVDHLEDPITLSTEFDDEANVYRNVIILPKGTKIGFETFEKPNI